MRSLRQELEDGRRLLGRAVEKAALWASQQDDAEYLAEDLEAPLLPENFNGDWTNYPMIMHLRNCIIAVNRCEKTILKSYGR